MSNTPANNKQNILVGAASLYIGNISGTLKPAFATASYNTTLASVAWDPNSVDQTSPACWNNVGYTMNGLTVDYTPTYTDVPVDQLLDAAVIFKQDMKIAIKTELAEATLYNLMISWGQSASTLTSDASTAQVVVDGGSLGQAPLERSLIAVGNGAYGRLATDAAYSERVYQKYRVLNVDPSTHVLQRNAPTGIPVSFRALPASDGTYGIIKDRKKTW